MKDKKISSEQMDQLMLFTQKHYVDFYDLQCELADHMANAIEERWQHEPNLSFNEALHLEFKKFGIFGFTTVVEQRQAVLHKKYHRLIWGYFKAFIKLPRIILTLALIVLAYYLISFSVVIYSIIMMTILVSSVVMLIVKYYRYNKRAKLTGKKWLLEDIINKGGGAGSFLFVPYYAVLKVFNMEPSPLLIWCMAVTVVAFILYQYIILFIIPLKAQQHLENTYPEYNFQISQ